ncbi:purine-cytosine permease [Xylariales sp. PMI_506]|nr:purine-cytosine permease [Xylariales sp. PMI_506]
MGKRGSHTESEYTTDRATEHQGAPNLGDRFATKLQRLAARLGIEQRGIEPVPPEQRTETCGSRACTLWLSANMAASSFAIGALALPVFNLGFAEAAAVVVLASLLGVMPVCFFSTFGPRFGLRQVVLSRFYFGWYGCKIIAVFNILACIGWSACNAVVGAQLFHAVNGAVPGWAGVLFLSTSTLLICAAGYRVVHAYERWSWIPCTLCFLAVLGVLVRSGGLLGGSLLVDSPSSGGGTELRLAEAGGVLSFGAAVFAYATGWCTYAADYTVYQTDKSNPRAVFAWTFVGLFLPLCFTELLGAAVMTATSTNEVYLSAYSESGVGGLLAAVLVPPMGRFGEFCVVVLGLSTIANNCPNIYSVSLSLQILSERTQRIPRFLWTLIATVVYIGIGIPAYENFEQYLEDFMLVLSYWLGIYEGISLTEHFAFRRGFDGYRTEDFAEPCKLPPGFAATIAFGFGIMGAALGMAQTWYIGPIGKLCGTMNGGDVGFELALAFSTVSYIVTRTVERNYFSR